VLPNSFSAELWASGPVFIFCALGLGFGGTEGVGDRFHVLRSRTLFRRYRVRRVPFSCFALPDSFSVVLRASRPIFMFCAPGLIFIGTEGLESRIHVFRSWTSFQRNRGRQVKLSCFSLRDSFSTVEGASDPVFMFCTPGHIFGDTEGVGSYFHVLRTRTRFQWYRGRRVRF
jgi:hypothetical protein